MYVIFVCMYLYYKHLIPLLRLVEQALEVHILDI